MPWIWLRPSLSFGLTALKTRQLKTKCDADSVIAADLAIAKGLARQAKTEESVGKRRPTIVSNLGTIGLIKLRVD